MKSISFAWTTPALLAGQKTVTRRDWKPNWAAQFRADELVAAYNRQPMYAGVHVATIRLTSAPSLEFAREAPESDFEAEGFAYLGPLGIKVDGLAPQALWQLWQLNNPQMWVVRFALEEVTAEGRAEMERFESKRFIKRYTPTQGMML